MPGVAIPVRSGPPASPDAGLSAATEKQDVPIVAQEVSPVPATTLPVPSETSKPVEASAPVDVSTRLVSETVTTTPEPVAAPMKMEQPMNQPKEESIQSHENPILDKIAKFIHRIDPSGNRFFCKSAGSTSIDIYKIVDGVKSNEPFSSIGEFKSALASDEERNEFTSIENEHLVVKKREVLPNGDISPGLEWRVRSETTQVKVSEFEKQERTVFSSIKKTVNGVIRRAVDNKDTAIVTELPITVRNAQKEAEQLKKNVIKEATNKDVAAAEQLRMLGVDCLDKVPIQEKQQESTERSGTALVFVRGLL